MNIFTMLYYKETSRESRFSIFQRQVEGSVVIKRLAWSKVRGLLGFNESISTDFFGLPSPEPSVGTPVPVGTVARSQPMLRTTNLFLKGIKLQQQKQQLLPLKGTLVLPTDGILRLVFFKRKLTLLLGSVENK